MSGAPSLELNNLDTFHGETQALFVSLCVAPARWSRSRPMAPPDDYAALDPRATRAPRPACCSPAMR